MTQESAVQGKDISYNRIMLEKKTTKFLVLNHKLGKDTLKQRDSGLNQVLCKIARDNSITFIIDLTELQIEDKKTRAKILGRIIQNIKLIKKFKNKLKIINYTDKYSAFSFLVSLGLPTNMSKEAIN